MRTTKRKPKIVTIVGFSHWAGYLVNHSSPSECDLTFEDVTEINAWLDYHDLSRGDCAEAYGEEFGTIDGDFDFASEGTVTKFVFLIDR